MKKTIELIFISRQDTGLNRIDNDKFYTKDSTVEICLNNFKKNVELKNTDLIIEPSAGNGSFIKGIKKMSDRYLFYDLKPENNEIIKQDYLILNTDNIEHDRMVGEDSEMNNKIHVIGNPPFGRQCSMAIKFIKKSCEFCDTLSFILPKSFKKDSLKKSFPLSFHLIHEIDLPCKSFLINGKEHDVPCVFQIWKKELFNRDVPKILKPKGFVFVKKDEFPDISVRRVGVYAGKIDTSLDKNIQSHYFIKFTNNKSLEDNIDFLSQIKYEFNNNTGPKSLSKQELICKYNELL